MRSKIKIKPTQQIMDLKQHKILHLTNQMEIMEKLEEKALINTKFII